jgi:hypothetical protein
MFNDTDDATVLPVLTVEEVEKHTEDDDLWYVQDDEHIFPCPYNPTRLPACRQDHHTLESL